MSSDLDLNRIGYQSNLRDKPVRENFTDIENNFNSLRSEVYASIASTASEVTSARDNFDNLTDNIHARLNWGNIINGTSDYSAETGATALTIRVAAGDGVVNGVGVENTVTLSATTTAPAAGKKRIDTLLLNTDNSITISKGTEVAAASVAQYPSIASTQEITHHYTIYDTTTDVNLIDDRSPLINPFNLEEYSNAHYDYSGQTLNTITITDKQNVDRFYQLNYTGATIASIGVTVDTKRYTTDYTFNGQTLATISQTIS